MGGFNKESQLCHDVYETSAIEMSGSIQEEFTSAETPPQGALFSALNSLSSSMPGGKCD